MKSNYLRIIAGCILLFLSESLIGQTSVKINNMTYISGTPISNGGSIEIESGSTSRIQFAVEVNNPNGTQGTLKVFTKRSSNDFEQQQGGSETVFSGNTFFGSSRDITLNASSFNTTGGSLFAQFETTLGIKYTSNTYSIAVTTASDPAITSNTISGTQTINEGQMASTLTGSNPSGGNGSYTYQWQKRTSGSWGNISGASSKNHSPGALNTTTAYRRIVSSGNAANNTSNTVTINVNSAPLITNNTISFNGINKMIGSTPLGGTGTYSYKWLISNNVVHDEILSGENGKDLVVPQIHIDNPSFGTHFKRIVSSGSRTSDSGYIPVHITNQISNNTISFNGINKMIGSTPLGGTGAYSYKWLISNNVVHDEILSGENGKDLVVPQIHIDNPSFGTNFKRIVNSGNRTSDSGYIPVHSTNRISKNFLMDSLGLKDKEIKKEDLQSKNTILYPNPSKGNLNFSIFIESPDTKLKITMINIANGKVFNVYDGTVQKGEKIIKWDKPLDLSNGIYSYVITKNEVPEFGKVIFQ